MRNKSLCENCENLPCLFIVYCDPKVDNKGNVITCTSFKEKQTIIQTILNTITFKKKEEEK
jgi:hypothetical protein